MSKGGPEQLLTHKLTLKRLAQSLGVYNSHTEAVLEELSHLSVASFDIESMTVRLDHQMPNSGAMPYAEIDSASQANHSLALQKPIMLAHRDGMMSDDQQCTVFTLESDEEASVFKLLQDYWNFVRVRQSKAAEIKLKLAALLLERIAEYEKSYFQYCQQWIDPTSPTAPLLSTDEVSSGFKMSLPGRMKTQLLLLVNQYEIFSFYGAGYDHVLLESYLVPHLFEKKFRPKLEKAGNKVTSIRIARCHVTFRDVMKLLSPGTSLCQFGQLFNLSQEKAHFPFGLLDKVDALKIPKIPNKAEQWISDLGPQISQSEVDEAQKLFTATGCSDVGDYLKTYLRLDCCIKWCNYVANKEAT